MLPFAGTVTGDCGMVAVAMDHCSLPQCWTCCHSEASAEAGNGFRKKGNKRYSRDFFIKVMGFTLIRFLGEDNVNEGIRQVANHRQINNHSLD
jgi:hypothetical protein